jgi:exodeoxyribonuclease VII small subunit
MKELSELVAWFQSGAFKLEESLEKFKQAELLADDIENELTKLKNEIHIIHKKFDSDN